MTGKRTQFALAGALLAGMSAPAMAESSTDLESEISSLKAQLAELRQEQNEDWLTERRSEEIKGLVKEVLADADTRASLLAEGATAGIDEKGKIFLQSADGSWKINFSGQLQFRYIWNREESRSPGEEKSGFQMRRSKFKLRGHIADPKLYYVINMAADREGGDVIFEDAFFGYKWDNGLFVQAGVFKLPFARQELVSSSRQASVDRSMTTEYFTLDRGEQVQIGYNADMFKLALSASDGADADWVEFDDSQAHDFALTGRVDVKLAGDWKQMKDELAWGGEEMGLFVGGAFHYQSNDNVTAASSGGNPNFENWYAATVDALFELDPFSVTGAYFFADGDTVNGVSSYDAQGFYVQGAVNINDTWAPYIRYNFIEQSGNPTGTGSPQDIQSVNVGINYFLKKHAAKLTADIVYIFDGETFDQVGDVNAGEFGDGLGLQDKTASEDQIAVRVQFQVLF